MSALFQITLVNAVSAAILALAVALAGRLLKRPAVLHTLWILVLLQLFMPPVIEVGLLPRPAPLQRATPEEPPAVGPTFAPGHLSAGEASSASVAGTTAPLSATPPRLGDTAAAIWFAGTVWVLALVLVRNARFRRLLRAADARDTALDRRLARLAQRMGVRKPGLRLVHASISPLIRPRLGGAELLFPTGLLQRLDAGEQEAILVHELAHVVRRDHWVRLLELIAVSLFWWHPAVWWARSRLRLVEERCCDQLVMQTLPRGRSSYARGLLKTVEFLAGTRAGVPALASGVGEVRDLKERLTMILKDRPPKSMSKLQRSLLALCAVSILLIFPTWSDQDLNAAPTDDAADTHAQEMMLAEAEDDYINQRMELEQQALELKRALRDIRERQAELERVWRSEMRSHELDDTQIDAARAKAENARARAVEQYERAREFSRQAEREARGRAWDRDRAAELRLRIAALEHHLQESIVTHERERRDLDRERMEAELDRLRAESYEHREAGRAEMEERIRRELEIQLQLEELERERSNGGGTIH